MIENVDKSEKVALATLTTAMDNNNEVIPQSIVVHANARNKLGEVLLTANIKQQDQITASYTKIVKIIPLW